MKLAAVAATTALTAALVVAPAPAEARGLCWLGVCGYVSNNKHSNASLHYQCADGKWRWLHPGGKSTQHCKDANKIHTSPTKHTWRYVDGYWMPLPKGKTLAIHDGWNYFVKVRA